MANRYWIGNTTGDWENSLFWAATSGGTGGQSVPTENDDVFIDANSFNTSGRTIRLNTVCKCRNINFSPDVAGIFLDPRPNGILEVYGSAAFGANAKLAYAVIDMCSNAPPTKTFSYAGTDKIPILYERYFTLTLLSNVSVGDIRLQGGSIDFNENDVTVDGFTITSTTAGFDATNSTLTVNSGLVIPAETNVCNFTGSTVIMNGTTLSAQSQVFNNIEFKNTASITGSNTFADIKLTTGKTLTVEAGSTQAITSLTGDGTKAQPITLKSSSVGSTFTISKASGTVEVDRYIIQDCKATGGATFIATNSKAIGVTSGWNIIAPQTEITYKSSTFTHSDIVEGRCNTQHALAGESLAYDTLDFTIWSETAIEFTQGDPLDFYFDEELINKFYLLDVKQVGKELYQFSCVSAIGLLEMSMHYGNIYTGTLLTDVLAEILSGITYSVDPLVSGIRLYGWLPYDTKRNNLQQITIATALSIKMDSDGALIIGSLSADTVGTLGADRCVLGGKVDKLTPCTAVQVTEHYYSQTTETIVLFDDTFTTQEVILFPEPVHDLTITGGTIVSSGANHAIVQGSGAVYLTGQKYIHNTRLITEGTVAGDSTDHIITVGNSTLITLLNSYSVAERIFQVYSYPSEIRADVLYGAERPGDVVSIVNPYTELTETAFARKMDIQLGSFLKASSDFLIDYVPQGAVTNYANRVLLTTNQTWTVPAGVEKIRAIVCGGGDGGKAGTSGTAGTAGSTPYYDGGYKPPDYARGEGGKGGVAGALGEGGNVLFTDEIAVTGGQQFAVVIGAAGTGGATSGAAGSAGGNTTFGSYTSADGTKRKYGFTDIGSGSLLGVYGKEGTGAADGKGAENPFNGRAGDTTGLDGTQYYGGEAGKVHDGTYAYAYGGGGSGATGTSNGGKGADGSGDNYRSYGGAGAAGIKGKDGDNATLYGGGGGAGSGGSGGGGGGSAAGPYGNVNTPGPGGAAGAFGKGGNGKAGCVIIYY